MRGDEAESEAKWDGDEMGNERRGETKGDKESCVKENGKLASESLASRE